MACSKCLTHNPIVKSYTYVEEEITQLVKVDLCYLCNVAYDQNLLSEFMKEDFGSFPISPITRNMIEARIKRARGKIFDVHSPSSQEDTPA